MNPNNFNIAELNIEAAGDVRMTENGLEIMLHPSIMLPLAESLLSARIALDENDAAHVNRLRLTLKLRPFIKPSSSHCTHKIDS